MKKSFLPTAKLLVEPYCNILGFPRFTKKQLQSRLRELESLGITKIVFWGSTRIGNLNILGKGYVGIVLLGKIQNKVVAIKIRRTDSQRAELITEAKLLQLVNKINVGPKFIASSKNFLIMEYLDGQKIGEWIENEITIKELKNTLRKILEDCYRLDRLGFDHGELSTISKHIIIGKKITMIDFESSSTKRRVSNITSATQGLFIGSGISRKVSTIYKINTKKKIILALRKYKVEMTRESFEELLRVLKLS